MKAKPTKSAQPKRSKLSTTPDRVAGKLFDRVASILDEARSSVVRAVNSRMVLAYWLIGREIVQELQGGEDRAEYGKKVIKGLSNRLTLRYGPGYSVSSLRDFRWFYTVFQKHHTACGEFETLPSKTGVSPIQQSLCAEFPSPFHPSLSWSHYRAIMRVEKHEKMIHKELIV